MSYGRSYPTVFVPMTLVCKACGVSITIQVDAGKDYIYEDTCREAENMVEYHCAWKVHGSTVLCASCVGTDDTK